MSDPAQVIGHERDGVTVLVPTGEFDISNVYLLRDPILAALEARSRVVIDLTGTGYVDSTVLGALVAGAKRARGEDRWLRLVNPQGQVLRVLEITALDTLFGIFGTVDAALSAQ